MSLSPGLVSRRILFTVLLISAASMAGWPDTGRSLFFRDAGQNHLPNRALAVQMMRSGELPLWNPHRGNGQPFLANPNSLILRPTTPLFLLFPPDRAHVPFLISVMLLSALAAGGTFMLIRESGGSDPAAALGALAFILSGSFQSLGQVVNLLEGAAWIPMTLWLFHRSLARGWRVWAPLAGISMAMVISTGEPVLAAILGLSALALPALRRGGPGRLPAALTVTLLVALLVAAAQLLPLLDLVGMSSRGGGVGAGELLKWSLPPAAVVETVVPRLWGDPARAGGSAYWGSGLFETSLPFFPSIHLGMTTLMLCALALLTGWRRAWPAAGVGLLGLVLSLGRFTPVHGLLVGWLPALSQSRYPVKWFLLSSLCAALLAARGFDGILAAGRGGRQGGRAIPVALALLAAAGALLWLSGEAGSPVMRWLLEIPSALPDALVASSAVATAGMSLGFAAAGALLFHFVCISSSIHESRRSALALVLAVLPLFLATAHANPKAPPGLVFERSPLLDLIPEGGFEGARLYGEPRPRGFAYRMPTDEQAAAAGLPGDSLAWGMRWDSRTLRFVAPYLHGVRGAYDQGGESLLGLGAGAELARRLKGKIPLDERVRFLKAASVGWMVGYGLLDHPDLERLGGLPGESNIPVGLYALRGTAPRASLIAEAIRVESPSRALAAIGSGSADPTRVVLLEGEPPREAASSMIPPPGGSAEIMEDRAGRMVVRVRTAAPAWLVITDTWAPGWQARVSGEPAEILRANGMFRAVRVPSGDHRVECTYRPGAVRRGAMGSVLGLVAAAALILAGRRRPAGERES